MDELWPYAQDRRPHRRRHRLYRLDGRPAAASAHERAAAGLFLGFQYPVEIPGVNNVYLLKAAVNAARKHRGLPEVDAFEFLSLVRGEGSAVAFMLPLQVWAADVLFEVRKQRSEAKQPLKVPITRPPSSTNRITAIWTYFPAEAWACSA